MIRAPYSEPYTLRERLRIQYDLKRYDLYGFFRDGLWQRIAWKLPRPLVKWCFIRVSSSVTDREPDQITYPVAYKAWEDRKDQRL
jgi:hypothetical protein